MKHHKKHVHGLFSTRSAAATWLRLNRHTCILRRNKRGIVQIWQESACLIFWHAAS